MPWIGLLTITLVMGLILLVWDFGRRTLPSTSLQSSSEVAVAFTGQYSRVTHALHLLETQKIKYLLISGVNRGAGMTEDYFTETFPLSEMLHVALNEGTLELGTKAHTTLQNAQETRCWIHRRSHSGPVLLITSPDHMPRASIALEATLPDHEIQRAVVPDGKNRMIPSVLLTEFAKYLVTHILAATENMQEAKMC